MMDELVAYKALLRVLRFDANLKALRHDATRSIELKELSRTERFAYYGHLIKRLNREIKFEALEQRKIKADVYAQSVRETYLTGVIGRKILSVWNSAEILDIMKH